MRTRTTLLLVALGCAAEFFVSGQAIVWAAEPAAKTASLNAKAEKALLAEDWAGVLKGIGQVDLARTAPEVRIVAGHAFLALSQNDEALKQFLSVSSERELKAWKAWTAGLLERSPESATAWYLHGDALARLQDWDGSVSAFSKALELHRNYGLALNARGVAKAGKGQWPEALADLLAANKADPQLLDAQMNLGALWIQWRTGADGAMATYGAVAQNNPKCILALHGLACAQFATGNLNEALADFEAAAIKTPWFSDPAMDLIVLLNMKDRFVKPVGVAPGNVRPGMSINAATKFVRSLKADEARTIYLQAGQNRDACAFFAAVADSCQRLLPVLTTPKPGGSFVPGPGGMLIGASRGGATPQFVIAGKSGNVIIRIDISRPHGQKPHINIEHGDKNEHTDKDNIALSEKDVVTIRVGGGKVVIERDGEKVGEYEVPEADNEEEIVIRRGPDGKTVVEVGGKPVGEVIEKDGKTIVRVGDKEIEVDVPKEPNEKDKGEETGGIVKGPKKPGKEGEKDKPDEKDAKAQGEPPVGMEACIIVFGPMEHYPPPEDILRPTPTGGPIPPFPRPTHTGGLIPQIPRKPYFICRRGPFEAEKDFWVMFQATVKQVQPDAARISPAGGVTAEDLLHSYVDTGEWLNAVFGLAYPVAPARNAVPTNPGMGEK